MIIKTPMPINCVECDNRGIRGIVDCKLIYSGCANCGRHPNCPLKDDSDVEDCIDRKCVLDKIQRLINAEQNNIDEHGDYMNYARERVNAYEAIQFFVENDCLCPSVIPQKPRKRHWISHIEHCKQNNLLPSALGSYFWCSNCETGVESTQFHRVEYNYCPKCGAKMVEPQ